MFQIIKKGGMMLALAALAFACQPRKDFPEAPGDYNTPQVVIGKWNLASVVQNDEGAIAKNFPAFAQKQDITAWFPQDPTKATVDINADSSFTVSNPEGSSIIYLPQGSGYKWRMVDPVNGPRYLQVYNSTTGEVARIDFGMPYRKADNKLSLRIARRNADGVPFVSYDYNLTK